MTLPLSVQTLRIRGFRNLSDLSLTLSPRVNVLSGANGHGKTSVLEALYFLSTSRSFRTERVTEVRQQGAAATRVEATFLEGSQLRNQSAALAGTRRSFQIDGKKPERLSSYATRTPLVVFHPGDLLLVSGPASLRRTLLDRVALYTDPSSSDARARYAAAQRERQALLEQRGCDAAELQIFEQLMASAGLRVRESRERAFRDLEAALQTTFQAMAARDLTLRATSVGDVLSDEAQFQSELKQRRERDRARKSPSYGPQRDDVLLELNGRAARRHASQGQQRILTLALKIAELTCIRRARGAEPILLLDDVSSELDPERTGAVYDFVREASGQVLVTTTRPELFSTPSLRDGERRDFRLIDGSLQADEV